MRILAIVERAAEVEQAVLYAVFPSVVRVGVEVFVHGCVGLLHLGVRAALEREVQCLEDVPAYGELAVPQEALREGEWQGLRVLYVVYVAFLQLVVGALYVGAERDVLRCEGEVLLLYEGEPHALGLYVLQRLPNHPDGCPRVVHASFPALVRLVDGGYSLLVRALVGVVECEV